MRRTLTLACLTGLIALAVYATCPPCAPPFDYYVDSVNGNDSNTGTSAGAAFATLATAMTALSAHPTAMRLGLARGSVWRESLAVTDGYTIASYGTGRLPLIDGSNVVTADLWSKTGGRTNIYQFSWVTDAGGGANSFYGVTEDGYCLIQVYTFATCDSTAGSFYAPTFTVGTGDVIYVHATGSGNPAANGKLYEATKRSNVLVVGNDCVIRQLKTRMAVRSDGSLAAGLNVVIDGCVACDGSRHICLIVSGKVVNSYFYGGYGEGAHDNGAGIFSVNYLTAYADTSTHVSVVLENDFFVNENPLRGASGTFSHGTGVPSPYDYSYSKNLYTYQCSNGSFGAGGTIRTDMLHCVADQTGSIGGSGGILKAQDSLFIGTNAAGQGWVFGANDVVTINNCRFANLADLNRVSASGTGSVSVTNSDIYNASSTTEGNAFIDPVGNLPAVFTHNVAQNAYYYILVPTGYAADYNVYWHNNGIGGYWDTSGTLYNSWATYTAANPTHDTHSQFADPLYLGDPAQDVWTKDPSSPAVTLGAGANANCATRPNWAAIITLMRAL